MDLLSPQLCRVFPFESADGPTNMARDEAMLDLVAADPSVSAFRAYGWRTPTLSLGYFQSIADAEAQPRWRGLPIVRRPTGGGALLHDHELTYALAVPRSHPLAKNATDLYRAVHAAIAALITEEGLPARRRGDALVHGEEPAPSGRPFLCFSDKDREDVVAGMTKLVGSAQRRRHGAVLQHGSLLMARSPFATELAGATDLGLPWADPCSWSNHLRHRIPKALGFRGVRDSWDRATLDRAEVLAASVYRQDAWNRRR